MSHKGIILIEKAGQRIPDDILASAAKLYDTGVGFYTVAENVVLTQSETKPQTVEDLKASLADFEQEQVVIHLFKQNTMVFEDDLQPFVLLTDGDSQPLIHCFLEADFKKYQDDSSYSPAHQFYTNWFVPNFEEWLAKQDVSNDAQILEALSKDNDFQNAIAAAAEDKMYIVLCGASGKTATVNKNTNEKLYTWGLISDGTGFETPAIGAKKSFSVAKKPAVVDKSTPAPASSKPDMVKIEADDQGKPLVKMSEKERRPFIFKCLGNLDVNGPNTHKDAWKSCESFLMPAKKAKELGLLTVKSFQEMGGKIGSYPPKADEPKEKPYVTVVSPEDRRKGAEFIQAIKIPNDPSTYKDMEDKQPLWSEAQGCDLEKTFKWLKVDMLEYAQKIPADFVDLAFQWRKWAMDNAPKKEEVPPKKTFSKAS